MQWTQSGRERGDGSKEEDRQSSARQDTTGGARLRLLARHRMPRIRPDSNTHAGQRRWMRVSHFFMLELPRLTEWEKKVEGPNSMRCLRAVRTARHRDIAARMAAKPGHQEGGFSNVGRIPAPAT